MTLTALEALSIATKLAKAGRDVHNLSRPNNEDWRIIVRNDGEDSTVITEPVSVAKDGTVREKESQ